MISDAHLALRRALGELPTVLYNSLSEGTREPLVIALVTAIERQGYVLLREETDADRMWSEHEESDSADLLSKERGGPP